MKNCIVLILLLIISIGSFSQETIKKSEAYKTELIKRSNHQRTAARILLFGGVASWIGCFIIVPKIEWGPAGGAAPFYILFGIGLVSMPVSIPFFLESSRNKKKALSFSVKNESALFFTRNSLITKSIPSLALKFNF